MSAEILRLRIENLTLRAQLAIGRAWCSLNTASKGRPLLRLVEVPLGLLTMIVYRIPMRYWITKDSE